MKKQQFTMIELVTVIGIILIALAVTVPAIAPMLRGATLKGKASSIKALLMNARQLAVTNYQFYVITFQFDGPGDMNGDGEPGVAGEDDDEDGFVDEDANLHSFWVGAGQYIYERGYVEDLNNDIDITGSELKYTRNAKAGSEVLTYDTTHASNDDEDAMVDEGDTVSLEDVFQQGFRQNEQDECRGIVSRPSYLNRSEPVALGNQVMISRIWADGDMVLARGTLIGVAGKATEAYGTIISDMDMETTASHPNPDGNDYVFSSFAYGPDGYLYYWDDLNTNSQEDVSESTAATSLTIELRDRGGNDRRLITAYPNGLIRVSK